LLNKIERKLGKYAIRNLMLYIVIANAIVFFVDFAFKLDVSVTYLMMLIPSRVFSGEFWRLISFVAVPPSTSVFFIIVTLYLNYFIGMSLERQWGSFRMNAYYFIGMISTITVSLAGNAPATAVNLHLSLFLAFARLFPEHRLMLFFIIPVKVRWLGWLAWAGLAFSFVMTGSFMGRMLVVAPLVSYFLFFGKDIFTGIRSRRVAIRNTNEFRIRKAEAKPAIHKCSICGITELDNPDMDFRYCSKCNGDYEYCMEHLRTHEHRI